MEQDNDNGDPGFTWCGCPRVRSPQLVPQGAGPQPSSHRMMPGPGSLEAQPGRSGVSQATFQGQQLTCAILAGLSSPGLADASMVPALRFRPLAPYALGRGGVSSLPEVALRSATCLAHPLPLSGPVLLQPIPTTVLALRTPSPQSDRSELRPRS